MAGLTLVFLGFVVAFYATLAFVLVHVVCSAVACG